MTGEKTGACSLGCDTWPEDVGVEMNLLSAQQWHQAMVDVGFEVVEQSRLLPPADEDAPDWKHQQGTLMTLVRRPLES